MRWPRSSSASSRTSCACRRSRPPSTTSPRPWATSPDTGPTGTGRRGTRAWRCSCARSSRPTARSSFTPSSTTRRASPRRRRRRAGGVHLRPERRQGLRGQDALPRGDGRLRGRAAGGRDEGHPVRRPQRRARADRRQQPGSRRADDRPASRGAGAVRADPERRRAARRRARARAGQRRALHLVGALAQPAPAQHRLAHRLPARQRRAGRDRRRAASRSARSAPAITPRLVVRLVAEGVVAG